MNLRTFFVFGLLALLPFRGLCAGAEPVFPLKKLLISDTEANVRALPDASGGNAPFFVSNVALLNGADFPAVVAPFMGQPITQQLAEGIAIAIEKYAKSHDRLLVKFSAPINQDPATGILRMIVAVGQYKDIVVRPTRWFSSKLLIDKLGIKPGDDIKLSVLENAVNWANASPFRQVKVLIDPLASQPDKANLIVGVQERIPLRLTLSYDNSGTPILGENRYTAGIQYGNLWGRDHQISYQYTTTDNTGALQSHSIDYRWPLPWHHYIQISGGYSKVQPKFGNNGAEDFQLNGRNSAIAARYIYPIRGGEAPMEFSAGLDFKDGNNNLLYDGSAIPGTASANQVFQVTLGYTQVRRDRFGAWLFGLNANLSPGHVTPKNTSKAYTRTDTQVSYATGMLSLQRSIILPHDWSVFSRLALQLASANIPGSEQIAVGGSTTVRGYNERIETGDEGFVFNTDLQTPALRFHLPTLKNRPPLETRLAVFYDYGTVSYKFPALGTDLHFKPLASAGLSLRVSLPVNFSLIADWGWQINERALQRLTFTDNEPGKDPVPNPQTRIDPDHYNARGHLKVVLAF